MMLATTTVENVDRFLEVFAGKGADKRAHHGCKGSTVFRDPTQQNQVWVLFDWDEQGWGNFVADPEVPPILKEAGHVGKPLPAALIGEYRA
jgi:quinol monooxygenase YgiN